MVSDLLIRFKNIACHGGFGGLCRNVMKKWGRILRKIAFLGAGNMGSAMIRAIIQTGTAEAGQLFVSDADRERLAAFAREQGFHACKDNREAVQEADLVFLAVKPVVVESVLEEIRDVLCDKVLVSIAAGVKVSRFTAVLGEQVKLVRTIPNLPALVGEGLSGLYFAPFRTIGAEEKEAVEALFSSFGKYVVVDREGLIDEMVAVTSSSPAYFCLLAEAMADGAVRAGFTRQQSYLMVEQAILGTAKLLLETGTHPAVLKDQVCSPGGTTIESVAALEKSGFRNCILEAMEACAKKARG